MERSISKEELENLPLIQFHGKIYIVETEEQMRAAAEMIGRETLLGCDTETKPAFKKGVTHNVALLQLSSDNIAWLFRLNKIKLSKEMIDILENPRILKTGVALHDDLRALQKHKSFTPAGFIDLQDMARKLGIEDFSLKKLAALTLNIRISKRQRLSNWEAPSLAEGQALYAATDAWVALGIYRQLKDNNI
jgi:ribonuclease D